MKNDEEAKSSIDLVDFKPNYFVWLPPRTHIWGVLAGLACINEVWADPSVVSGY